MKVGSLFAGIGGFDLAAERVGMQKAAPHDRPAPSPRPRETPPRGWKWDHESSPSTERDAPMNARGSMTPSGPGR